MKKKIETQCMYCGFTAEMNIKTTYFTENPSGRLDEIQCPSYLRLFCREVKEHPEERWRREK